MKKTFTLTALATLGLATTLLLTGCTPPGDTVDPTNGAAPASANFESKSDITVLPVWDISKLTPGMLGGETDPEVKTEVTEDGVTHYIPPVDTYLESYIYFENPETKCNISGRIGATETYKQARGDLYNSKDALYSMVSSDQKPVSNESTTTINDWGYVTGDFIADNGDGANPAHRAAVRVFSSPVAVVPGTFPADFNYQSDPNQGLPLITIDYTCPSPELINDEEWNKAISSIFTLDWTGGPSVTDINPTPIPQSGENLPPDPGTAGIDLTDPNQNPGYTPPVTNTPAG